MGWNVLYLKPRTEKKMAKVCEVVGVEYYLPMRTERKTYQRRAVTSQIPVFPSYLFACCDRTELSKMKEFDLLLQFARRPGRVYTRGQLLDLVWGYSDGCYEHTVNSHINRLRGKIEKDPSRPRYINTVWGVGYKFLDADGTGA